MDLLLLEDDADLGRAVAGHLVAAGHRVHRCQCIAEAAAAPEPALAPLDLQLPDGDGLDLLRRWRSAGQVWPVIVLTARDQVIDRIRGLQAGADGSLVKPFDLDELLARIAAVARHSGATAAAGCLHIDLDACRVTLAGDRIDLTQMEWTVLACLARRRGRIDSRGEIEDDLHAQGLVQAAQAAQHPATAEPAQALLRARPEIAALDGKSETEIEWQPLQLGLTGVDEVSKSLDSPKPSVVYKFQFFNHVGQYDDDGSVDPQSGRNGLENQMPQIDAAGLAFVTIDGQRQDLNFVGQQIAGFNANEVPAVPEPHSGALMLAGQALVGRLAGRRG